MMTGAILRLLGEGMMVSWLMMTTLLFGNSEMKLSNSLLLSSLAESAELSVAFLFFFRYRIHDGFFNHHNLCFGVFMHLLRHTNISQSQYGNMKE